MPRLTEVHVGEIERQIPQFRQFLESDEGRGDYTERRTRCELYQKAFSRDNINALTETELGSLLGDLWANEIWTDKSQPLKRLLSTFSIDRIKAELTVLLWGEMPLDRRFDEFRGSVKGMGPAAITELLTLIHPEDCAIWSSRVRKALETLRMGDILPVGKYQISGREYTEIILTLREIKDLVQSKYSEVKDLLDIDFFFDFIYENTPRAIVVQEDYDFDHDEVRDAINELGIGLGFESDIEVPVARGAKLDVFWKAKISNLGVVKYAFEVQGRGGSIDSLILNLQRAKADPAVQRLVAVSNTQNIEVIKNEIASLPEEFKKTITLMEAKDALKARDTLRTLKEIIDRLQLVQS